MAKEQLVLTRYIREIPDWPKKGILFRDITPLLGDPEAFSAAIDALCKPFKRAGVKYVAAIEARGFIFGAAVAARLRAGFIPIRKKGKLPWGTESARPTSWSTAWTASKCTATPSRRRKVLMVDDLLATGGTMHAACELMEKVGARSSASPVSSS